jgi:hypothetical protein
MDNEQEIELELHEVDMSNLKKTIQDAIEGKKITVRAKITFSLDIQD